MRLSELCSAVPGARVVGDSDPDISGIAYHSGAVQPGFLFVAVRGFSTDGHRFLRDAHSRGAAAAVVESLHGHQWPPDAPALVVPNSRTALALLAARFYNHPSRELDLYAVTGTNGKTTTTYLVERVLASAGLRTGIIGTLGCRILDRRIDSERTTPESLDLQRILREMVDAGVQAAAMEASSHALALGRTRATRFAGGVFTNLTQDHLDFHATLEEYFAAKRRLFTEYAAEAGDAFVAAVNVDSEWGRRLSGDAVGRVVTFGSTPDAVVRAERCELSPGGTSFVLVSPGGSRQVRMKLAGAFNAENALAAAALCLGRGLPLDVVVQGLEAVTGVPGRFESVDVGQPFGVIVDYAHTPDGLVKLIGAARRVWSGRIITVFGCGGDRDRGKRPQMGRIAADGSDIAIVTSDNPRSEDPEAIIDQVVAGVPNELRSKLVRISDRRQAIHHAISQAREGDVVLIAGKGHEDYQIIGSTKLHFDDREVAREALSAALHA